MWRKKEKKEPEKSAELQKEFKEFRVAIYDLSLAEREYQDHYAHAVGSWSQLIYDRCAATEPEPHVDQLKEAVSLLHLAHKVATKEISQGFRTAEQLQMNLARRHMLLITALELRIGIEETKAFVDSYQPLNLIDREIGEDESKVLAEAFKERLRREAESKEAKAKAASEEPEESATKDETETPDAPEAINTSLQGPHIERAGRRRLRTIFHRSHRD